MKIIENRKKFYIVSIIVILIGLVAMPFHRMQGRDFLNYDVEFKGGTMLHLDIGQPFNVKEDIRPLVEEYLGDDSAVIQEVTDAERDEVIITSKETDAKQREALVGAIKEKFAIEENPVLDEDFVSPTMSPEIKSKAIQAVLLGAALMLVYIWIRFKDFKFGASAVLALVHDVLVMLMVYAVFRVPINNSFIAAMLTIVGYSVNDTIIVFDRIRENRGKMKVSDEVVINTSVKQTISRSIYTSLTTLVMVVLLYVIGGTSVKEFAFPLVIGVLSGTYSSIFIASPLWYEMRKYQRKQEAKKASGK